MPEVVLTLWNERKKNLFRCRGANRNFSWFFSPPIMKEMFRWNIFFSWSGTLILFVNVCLQNFKSGGYIYIIYFLNKSGIYSSIWNVDFLSHNDVPKGQSFSDSGALGCHWWRGGLLHGTCKYNYYWEAAISHLPQGHGLIRLPINSPI